MRLCGAPEPPTQLPPGASPVRGTPKSPLGGDAELGVFPSVFWAVGAHASRGSLQAHAGFSRGRTVVYRNNQDTKRQTYFTRRMKSPPGRTKGLKDLGLRRKLGRDTG